MRMRLKSLTQPKTKAIESRIENSTFLNFLAGGPFSEDLRELPVERHRRRRSRRRRTLSAAVHFPNTTTTSRKLAES